MATDTFTLLTKTFLKGLIQLKHQLEAAQTHAHQQDYSEDSFLSSKLAPDMFVFSRQVQMVSDNAKGVFGRLAGVEVPAWADDEVTLKDLVKRIDSTIAYVSKFKPEAFDAARERKIVLPWSKGRHMTGKVYLTSFAIPNFYFHLVTAYNVLRNAGVKIGKPDFLGELEYAD